MTGGERAPRFSIVTAAYNVGRYLQDFIDSIEAQTHGLDDIEVVMVDDGSTDDTLVMLEQWAERRPGVVRVLTQANAGQGAARNLGLQHARGEWITLPDPDDILEAEYFARVASFLDRNPETAMVATNRIFLMEGSGEIVDSHPLRRMFAADDQLVDLDQFPDFFHGSAPASFVR
ncbi:MAG TPA: glycosyltransferase family A protein, partial [Jatrophihabitans sp.]|uniref:glycosyltransferase family 2 protein n=1 Tax=Jatrophihabitans sp. TaxID=1932789 RepID=UPI002E044C96|nr:glycosyltransferase family A protein [Jatrophihabitans sp.]